MTKSSHPNSVAHPFLTQGGEMGELTRRYDWSKTSIGSPDQWPLSLRTLLQMMLTSRFPMLIFWGPQLITFYNDAFRPSLGNNGKHPGSLGQRGEESWAESWPVIGPMIYTIMAGGNAVWFEDQKLPIYRDGTMSYAYWTYSFSPLTDDTGAVNGVLVTCSETTKAVENLARLQQANTQLQQTQKALQNAVDLSQLGIWKIDIATQSANFSQRVIDWVGSSQPLTLQDAIAAIEPADLPQFEVAFREAYSIESGGQLDVEYRLKNVKTGQIFLIHSMGQMQFDAKGNPLSINGFSQDVTQIRAVRLALEQKVQERTEELDAANEQLTTINEELLTSYEEANRSNADFQQVNAQLSRLNQDLRRSNENLQQFAYVASHDLQEPLRKIQSFSSLLLQQLEGQLNETSRDYIERITAAGARMSLLIKDLLAYSRIATRQQVFESVSLDAILEDARLTLEWEISQRQAQLAIDPLPVVKGDSTQLGQLFQNLLSNALKFTPAGQPPRVRVTSSLRPRSELPAGVQPTSEAPLFHQICISDQGVGFDTKYLDRIFQVFQRLHGRNEFPGSGVGLAICQRVAENHGGAITATSRPGEETVFWVYLPVIRFTDFYR